MSKTNGSSVGAAFLLSCCLVLLFTACQLSQPDVFRPAKLGEIDASVEKAIGLDKTPGGVFWLEHNGRIYKKAYGHMSLEPEIIPARVDAIYDAASLTKVVATTPSIMLLIERGEILLDAPVLSLIHI